MLNSNNRTPISRNDLNSIICLILLSFLLINVFLSVEVEYFPRTVDIISSTDSSEKNKEIWRVSSIENFHNMIIDLGLDLFYDPNYSNSFHSQYDDVIINSNSIQGVENLISKSKGKDTQKISQINSIRTFIPKDNIDKFIDDLKVLEFTSEKKIFISPQLSFKLTDVNSSYELTSTNDTYYPTLWYMERIQLDEAWKKSIGANNILIGIIDSGIDVNHIDLVNNIENIGYNWLDGNNNLTDDIGHGTHVAGTIAAEFNNSEGIAGIADIKIFMEKAFAEITETGDFVLSNAIIDAVDKGADIISGSWGGYNYSSTIHDAIKYAYQNDVISVFSAGNDNTNQKLYPGGLEETIAVGATDYYDDKASFSNYGDWVNITAPGTSIFSTLPGNNYGYKHGTSMATPIVAGVIGLMLSYYQSDISPQIIYNNIKYMVDDKWTAGYDEFFGWGRINADKALKIINRDFSLNWENNDFSLIVENKSLKWLINDPDLDDIHYSNLTLFWDNRTSNKSYLIDSTEDQFFFTTWTLQNRSDYEFELEVRDSSDHNHTLVTPKFEIQNPPHRPMTTWNSIFLNGLSFSNHEILTVNFNISELDGLSFDYQLVITDNSSDYLIAEARNISSQNFVIDWNTTDYPNGEFNYKIIVENKYFKVDEIFDVFTLNNTHVPRILINIPDRIWEVAELDFSIFDYDKDNIELEIYYYINNQTEKLVYNNYFQNSINFTDTLRLEFNTSQINEADGLFIHFLVSDSIYNVDKTFNIPFIRPRPPIFINFSPTNGSHLTTNFLLQWSIFDKDSDQFQTTIFYKTTASNDWILLIQSSSLTVNNTLNSYFIDIDFFNDGLYDFLIKVEDERHESIIIFNKIILGKISSSGLDSNESSLIQTTSSNATGMNFSINIVSLVLFVIITFFANKNKKHFKK